VDDCEGRKWQMTYFESENPHSGIKVEDLVPHASDKRLYCATWCVEFRRLRESRRTTQDVFSFVSTQKEGIIN
jgi:hypothetical protein